MSSDVDPMLELKRLRDTLSDRPDLLGELASDLSDAERAKLLKERTEEMQRIERELKRELNGRRRVVQLLAPAHVPGVNLWLNTVTFVALCDDGTIWLLGHVGDWNQLDGPPGTEGGTP